MNNEVLHACKAFALLTGACLAVSSALAARTVEISSRSESSVVLSFGPGDGKAYQLYVGQGALDAGGDVTAWSTFAKVADIADDASSYTYPLPTGWGTAIKAARFFLAEPSGGTITSEWWRITFTKNVYGGYYDVQLGDLRFYDNTTDLQSSTDMAQGLVPGSGTDASALAKGQVITTFVTSTTKPSGAQCNLWDIRNAFDGEVFNAVWAPSSTSLESAPKSITWRLAEGKNRVQCYKVFSSYMTWYLHPCAWKVEVSDDGRNWTLVDQRSGQQSSSVGVSIGGASPYFPNVPRVSSQTASLTAMNVLTVEKGSPLMIDTSETYDEVRLYDKLTFERAGKVTAGRVVVCGPEGGVILLNGAVWNTATKLVLSADCVGTNGQECVDLMEIYDGCTFTSEQSLNENATLAARILFHGGNMRATGFGGKPLLSTNGGMWILESVGKFDIFLGDLGLQRMEWLSGEGSVETRGPGRVVVIDNNYNQPNDWRGMVYMTTTTTADNWKHAGDFAISNAAMVVCRADDCLPFGAQTGGISLGWGYRQVPFPLLDLNGRSVAVNGIRADYHPRFNVTNSSSAAATLVLGRDDVDGVVSNIAFTGWNVNLRKVGSGKASLLRGDAEDPQESRVGAISVEAGTLVVSGLPGDLLWGRGLTLGADSELVVDGLTLRVEGVSGAGRITELNGGRVVYSFGSASASDRQAVYDAIHAGVDEIFKDGASRAIVQQESVYGGDVTVNGGTLVFSGRQCTNEWFRWVLKRTLYNDNAQIALGELYLYPDAAKSEHLAKGLVPGESAATLQRKQLVASFATTTTKNLGGDCNLWDIRNLFDDGVYSAVNSLNKYQLSVNNQTITFRLEAGKNRVGCYLPANSYCTWQYHPSDWDFQTSPDGANWLTVDSRSGQYLVGGGGLNGGVPYPIKGYEADNAKGFSSASCVTVAAGAVLDVRGVAGGQTISRLGLDAPSGGGTIVGGRIAETGTICLKGVARKSDHYSHPIPLTFEGTEGTENLKQWNLEINGSPVRNGVRYADGGLYVNPTGTLIVIR